jgi:hypothetical protein
MFPCFALLSTSSNKAEELAWRRGAIPPQKNILNDISILIGDGEHTHETVIIPMRFKMVIW